MELLPLRILNRILLLLMLLRSAAMAKMVISSEPGRLNKSSTDALAAKLAEISATILPNATYYAGESFSGSLLLSGAASASASAAAADAILINFHFYAQTLCPPSFVATVAMASGSTLQAKFAPLATEALELAIAGGYGSGVVILGQFQVGYTTQGSKLVGGPDNCTRLSMSYNNTLDYCFGYRSVLQSHTPWNHLYSDCSIRSSNHRYLLQMQYDCNLVLTDTESNVVLWASDTYLAGNGCYLVLQEDMNLVIYDDTRSPKWASNTFNSSLGPTQLVLGNEGFASLFRSDMPGTVIWKASKRVPSDMAF